MKNNRQHKYLFKIFSICILGLGLISAAWAAIFYQVSSHRSQLVEAFAEEQYRFNSQFSDQVQKALAEYMNEGMSAAEAESKVISEVIQKETNSQNRYIFFYGQDAVLFEKDILTTEAYQDKTINEVFEAWKYAGGSQTEDMQKLMNEGISGTSEIIKDNETGKEIISWFFFEEQGKTYRIGISTLEDYFLTTVSAQQHFISLSLISGLFTVAIIVLGVGFSLYIFKTAQTTNRFKKEIREKNVQIEDFASQIKTMTQIAEAASTHDSETGVYNEVFLNKMLANMKSQLLLPVTVMTVDLSLAKNAGLLQQTVELFKRSCDATHILARINENELAVIMNNSNEESAGERMQYIRQKAYENFGQSIAQMPCGIAVKTDETGTLFETLEKAKNSLDRERSALRDEVNYA
ncbi:MAG: hypothetical protein K0R69_1330 [Clostridia bacterium]|nr:hypothetical protein [Clostridia bacterium]